MKVIQVDHVGIVVKDIQEAMKRLNELLGVEPVSVRENKEVQAKVAFVSIGDSLVELLEGTSPQSEFAKFLKDKGPGLHHLAVKIEGIEEMVEEMRKKGAVSAGDKIKTAPSGKWVFLNPEATNGIPLQLIERPNNP